MKQFFVIFLLFLCISLQAQEAQKRTPPERATYQTTKAEAKVKIDGVLDEPAWQSAAVVPLPYEWFPGDNVTPPVETECLVTYDSDYLYIGFRAKDPEPSKIRAHIMDRDAIDSFIQDDHVGVMLDLFNDERRAVQLRMNPLGVQMDAIFSETDGIEDFSWDIIWDSAGKITNEGYIVEISIPFNQLRFPETAKEQTWGFEAFRSYPRTVRHRISSTYRNRDISCLLCQEVKVTGFQGISPGRNLEFDPTVTASRTDVRNPFPEGDLEKDDQDVDPGLTARWGLTSSMTLNGALNPDFSQVEADVAQLDVNTRFALFFSEKRPFFLEGVDFFSTPISSVFTRTVADPIWGAKLTGKEGKNGVGVFVTRDEINNLIIPFNQFSDFESIDQDVTGTVLRYRRDVGKASTIGVLYSGREAEGYYNRQLGFDGFQRFSNTDTVSYQFLHSETDYPQDLALEHQQEIDPFGGNAFYSEYNHAGRDWGWNFSYEDFGDGFRADSGFIPRVDTRTANGFFQRTFYGDAESWYSQILLRARYIRTENHDGFLTDESYRALMDYNGPYQSFVEILFLFDKEFFNGVTYDLNHQNYYFEIKPVGSFSANIFMDIGDAIDFANSRQADQVFANPIVEFKVGRHINVNLNHTLQRLSLDEGTIFTANLSQIRFLYNFNTRMFVRAILQYTNIDRNQELFTFPVEEETSDLFTQFLFSYKLNARTVLFVGYSDNYTGNQQLDLTQTDRTFFMKVGYAFIF